MVLLGTAFGLSLGVFDLPLETLVGVLDLALDSLVDFGVEALGVDAFAASILSRRVLSFGVLLIVGVLVVLGVPPFVLVLVALKLAGRWKMDLDGFLVTGRADVVVLSVSICNASF